MDCPDCGEPLDREGLCPECDQVEAAAPVSMAPAPGEVGPIEEGVEIPPKKFTARRGTQYHWDQMKPGDSFRYTCREGQSVKAARQAVAASFRTWARDKDVFEKLQCVCRAVEGGVRVWVVKR